MSFVKEVTFDRKGRDRTKTKTKLHKLGSVKPLM